MGGDRLGELCGRCDREVPAADRLLLKIMEFDNARISPIMFHRYDRGQAGLLFLSVRDFHSLVFANHPTRLRAKNSVA
jgi:hypothetical protein